MSKHDSLEIESFAKVTALSFVLSILVVSIHLSTTWFYNLDNSVWYNRIFYEFSEFIRGSVARIAVPTFFWLSGVLFFRDFEPKKLKRKWTSRVKSLLIPYLSWNFISYIFSVILGMVPALRNYVSQRELATLSWSDFYYGVVHYKYNTFYWFMLTLIIQVLLALPIWYCLKNKYIGFVCIVLVIACEIPVLQYYYLIGAFVGIHFYDSFTKVWSKKEKMVAGVLLTFVILLVNHFKNTNDRILSLVLILAPMCTWVVFDSLRKIDISKHEWLKSSFFIYSSQVILASSYCKLLMILLPHNILGEIVDFFGTLFLTALTCCLFNKYCKKYLPLLCHILNGWRL